MQVSIEKVWNDGAGGGGGGLGPFILFKLAVDAIMSQSQTHPYSFNAVGQPVGQPAHEMYPPARGDLIPIPAIILPGGDRGKLTPPPPVLNADGEAGKKEGKGVPEPSVSDPKLKNIVNDLYKGAKSANPIGTGSTADAIRNELETGQPTGGKFHSHKGGIYINGLKNWLRNNPKGTASDIEAAKKMLHDLQSALQGK
jgi:hypothetical protein